MLCLICNKEFRLLKIHLQKVHNIELLPYYKKYILNDETYQKLCPICNTEITTFKNGRLSDNKLSDFCSQACARKGHSLKMKKLHEDGIYEGTSYFYHYYDEHGEEHKKLLSELSKARALDKTSKGFNSEYSDRIRNRDNLLKRTNKEDDRYLYVIEFDDKIKLGSSSDFNRRLRELKARSFVFHSFLGKAYNIINLECDLLLQFQEYTLIDETGKFYTEYLSKNCLENLLSEIKQKI
jgi:hypothetical protein